MRRSDALPLTTFGPAAMPTSRPIRRRPRPDGLGSELIRVSDDLVGPLDGRKIGVVAHRVVQSKLDQDLRLESVDERERFIARHPLVQNTIQYRQYARSLLVPLVTNYTVRAEPDLDW